MLGGTGAVHCCIARMRPGREMARDCTSWLRILWVLGESNAVYFWNVRMVVYSWMRAQASVRESVHDGLGFGGSAKALPFIPGV